MRCKALAAALLMVAVACPSGRGENPPANSESPSLAAVSHLYVRPGTKRVFLHQPADYKIVTARPDLKLQIKSATAAGELHPTGYGFVIVDGGKLQSFAFDRGQLRFEHNALPLLTEKIAQAGFVFEQTVFTTADAADRRVVMLRLRIVPENGRSAKVLKLAWLTVRDSHERYQSDPNEDYIVFEPWCRPGSRGSICATTRASSTTARPFSTRCVTAKTSRSPLAAVLRRPWS